MTEKRQFQYRTPILIGLSVLACVAICVLVPFLHWLLGGSTNCPGDVQSAIEGRAHIDIPASARNIDCGYIFMQGSDMWARFQIPPSDLDAFVQCTSVTSVSSRPIPKGVSFSYNTWFVKKYLYGDYSETIPSQGGYAMIEQHILVDIHDPTVYTVYFQESYAD